MTWLKWKNNEIKSIQILRAIAALSVVYVHCTTAGDYNFLTTGSFGVDIFFIISGFIIAYVIEKDSSQFLLKRIFRIYPMYIIATIMMIFTVLIFPTLIKSTTISFSGFIKSILFIPGIENRGYPILGQGWTLRFEMFFYLLMFICILIVRNKKYASLICAGFIFLFIGIASILKPINYFINYFCNDIILEFACGVLLFKCNKYIIKRQFKINRFAKISICIFVAVICYGFMVFIDIKSISVSKFRSLYYGIPSLLMVIAILMLEINIKDTKLTRIIIEIGEASYVMYLFHYHIVIFFSRAIFNKTIGANSIFLIELTKIIIAFSVTIIISVIAYEFVDKPIQIYLRGVLKRQGLKKQRHST